MQTWVAMLGMSTLLCLEGCARDLPRLMKGEAAGLPAEAAPAAAPPGIVPDDLKSIAESLMRHARQTYLAATGDYRFYMGGVWDARYNPESGILVLTADNDSGVVCKYSPEDRLYIPEANAAAAHQAICSRLRDDLRRALSR